MHRPLSILGLLILLAASCAAFDTKFADRAAEGHVCEVGIPWHFPSNRIDWLFNPTKAKPPFNPEWTWQLNRTGGWRLLADAYLATKDEKYARAFAVQLADWLDQTGAVPPEKGYNAQGSPWRTIEEGIRLMGPWPFAYRAFRHSPSLSDELRARFLACMRAQAKHLMAHRTEKGNWLLMEMNGVYTFACRFPELPESAALRKESSAILASAIREQVLPDGLHYELSPDYHLVFYICAAQMYELARECGFVQELPADYAEILERGADGYVKMMAPGFVQPRFNDCYTMETKRVLERAARLFPHRKDFLWAATGGAQGEPPASTPTASRYLPYSGFAVMRSGWDRDAAYLAFDVGPLGMGHWHQDKLSFTLWKGDEELVFDDGGGQYEVSDFRTYALSGYDHNTLIVDGLAQFRRDPKTVDGPVDAGWTTTPARDLARGTYDQGFGPKELKLARHVREIAFEKPELFRVTDTVTSADGQAHNYELLFHVDTTNVTVAADGRALVARFGKKWDLALTVEQGGAISLQSGVEKPRLAGWFVGRNNLTVHKATTISVKAPRAENATFVTTFRPVPSVLPLTVTNDVDSVVARRTADEKARGAGKRGWLAWEAERNPHFPAQNLMRVDEIAAMLPAKAELPGDPVRYRAEWDKLAATAEGKARIETAAKVLSRTIPPLTAETYEAYHRTGDRSTYRAQGERNKLLLQLLWGEVLENKGRFVAKIAEVLAAMCAEPSWIAPYEGGAADIPKPLHGIHYIDLTAASRAELVALALSYLRVRLPEATRTKALDVLRGRVFETFLADSRRKGETTPYHCWWMPDRFNWSAVCHNGCVTAILAVEDDPRVRAEAVESAERLMAPCFLDGFLADGYCEEGMGYWNYGFGNFLRLASTVRALTDGAVDWCRAFPKARQVAAFGSKYLMGRGSSPLFADGNGTPARDVLALANMNWPDLYAAEARGLSPFEGGLEICALRNFGRLRHQAPKAGAPSALPRRDWFAAAETLICRDGKLAFAIKGGSNGDRHNHDDAGSYLINVADREVAGDPGNENYTSRTFSRRRYESKVLNSYAHPVPRVGGRLQGGGPAFGAKLVKTEFSDAKDVVVYDLSGAYPAEVPVVRLLRTATFDRASHAVTIVDEAEFAAPTAFETPVVAWRRPKSGKDRGHFRLDNGAGDMLAVAVDVQGGEWTLGEEFVENPGRTQPYRLAIALKEPVLKATVSVCYRMMSEADYRALSPQMGVLTPPVRDEPRINGPRVFGVRPGHPVLWRIPVTGARPMSVDVKGLPAGAAYDPALGMVTGAVATAGSYDLAVTARNAKGSAVRTLALRVGKEICLTPPMGWNSWNCWGQEVSDEKMRRAADAMVASGLAEHGWSYVVVDDCWRTRPTELQAGFRRPGWIADKPHMPGPARKADGTPETNAWFPDMKAMADYIHAKGLRAGLYSVPSEVACCYTWGSWKHEAEDARTWASWGYDLVKYDWCYGQRHFDGKGTDRDWQIDRFSLMGRELAKQSRDMVYNVCQYGRLDVTRWAKGTGAHYWRTNDDLKDTWPLLLRSIDENLKVADAAGPDGWNDPDMLVVGPMRSNGFTKSRLTPNEQYTHISLWAIMAAPLFIGCDLERLPQDPLALSLLTNDEVIDIDQDELGKVGRPVVHTADYDVWARPLANGDWAVALFNRTWEPLRITAAFRAFGAAGELAVRDVWAQKDLGTFRDAFAAEVYGHATRLFRLGRVVR